MHLIYLDESGNSGTNLSDPQQPIFVLGALIVPEQKWKVIEAELIEKIEAFFEGTVPNEFEIHASEIRGGRSIYKDMDLVKRIAFRDELIQVALDHELCFIYRAIAKKRFAIWLEHTFGKGIAINPHIADYPLVSQSINTYLRGLGEDELGILINDDNKEVVSDIERTTKLLRAESMSDVLAWLTAQNKRSGEAPVGASRQVAATLVAKYMIAQRNPFFKFII